MHLRCIRCVCTSATLEASKMQLGRILNKVLSQDRTRKTAHKEPQINVKTGFDSPQAPLGPQMNRRVTVLNKLFMRYITDLMSTGEVASKLLGKGIEVTSVKVANDYKLVNVYWSTRAESHANEFTEKILRETAGQLQHELSQLRIIGAVPPIRFVKNKYYTFVTELDNRLSKVDFGEDFEPSTYIIRNKIPVIETSLPNDIKAQISNLNTENTEEDEAYEIDIPPMRQDVIGFDHSAVMKKIKYALNKSKTSEINQKIMANEEPVGNQVTLPSKVPSFLSKKDQQTLFDDFLKKRTIEEKRKLKTISLRELKLEEEEEWQARMNDDYIDDLPIEEEFDDDHKDTESFKT